MSTRYTTRPALGITLPFLLSTATLCGAAEMPTIDDPELNACVDRSMPAKTLTQDLVLRSYDDTGLIEESVADVYWQRGEENDSRAVIRLNAPASRKGLAVLMVETDAVEPRMFLYVPDLKRTRKVTGVYISKWRRCQ